VQKKGENDVQSLFNVLATALVREAAKKSVFFLVARPLSGWGGGGKGLATKKNYLRGFFWGGDIFGYRDTK